MSIKFSGENVLTQLITLIKGAFVAKVEGKGLSTQDFTTEEKGKLSGIEAGANAYTLPTASADTKGGVKIGAGLEIIGDTLNATGGGTADSVDWSNVTNRPTIPTVPTISTDVDADGSSDDKTVSPQAVKTYVDGKVSAVYKPQGTIAFASLPALSEIILGYVYNVSDAFNSTADFVEGAGVAHSAGTNVVCVSTGNGYKWDALAGSVDLSAYARTADFVEFTNTEVTDIWNSVS